MSASAWPLLAIPGLLTGAVVRVVAWRLGVEDPPRVACPNCGAGSRTSLGPVGSFTARCRVCGARSGPGPLIPEVLCAVGFTLAGWIGGGAWRVAAVCWLVAFGLAAVLVDAAVQRLPDLLTVPCLVGVVVFSCGQAVVAGSGSAAVRTVLAGAAAGGCFLVMALLADVGLGDVKLAAGLGAALGYVSWSELVTGLAAGLCLAGMYAAVKITAGRGASAGRIALGPHLLAGALLVLALAR